MLTAKITAFLNRLRSLPGHVLTVTVLVDANGDLVYWQVTDSGKAEGLSLPHDTIKSDVLCEIECVL